MLVYITGYIFILLGNSSSGFFNKALYCFYNLLGFLIINIFLRAVKPGYPICLIKIYLKLKSEGDFKKI